MNKQTEIIGKGTDQQVVIFYYLLVCIGLIAIFSVEYRFDDPFWETLIGLKKNYSKQLLYLLISSVFAAVILLIDSKFFAASANLFYFFGVVLMLLTFVIGKDISGSRSWIVLGGGFNLQPAELCKVFTSLALAKYMSRQDTDFTKTRSHVIAISLALFPALLSIAQKETGLALVYFSFFLVLFREGLPANYLITGFSVAVLFVTSIVMPLQYYNILIGAVALIIVYIQWRRIRKKYTRLLGILFIAGLCIGIKYFVDYIVFDKILKPYQSERVLSMFGKSYVPKDETRLALFQKEQAEGKKRDYSYNVKQSKIAIGSGGLLGKGFLKGVTTQGDFVPEQHTDFIFTAIAESFGFWGSTLLVLLYFFLLLRIIRIGERQRSTF